ncbi:MAG: substrate-binding domain-containing protein [Myxococcales bacterium]
MRHLSPIAACLLALLCGAGCRRDPPPKETLLIAGNAALARYLEPLVKEFVARNPNASVVVEPGGSTAAVIALKRGAIDIAALSRLVGAEEDDAYLHDYQVCRDGLAIAVHPGNPVTNLTRQQLDEIFSGEVLNWKQVGGPDLPIVPYVREKSSRSSRSFNELVLGGDEPFSGAKAVASSKEMLEHVAKEPGAIGFITLRRQSKGGKDGAKDPEVATIKIRGSGDEPADHALRPLPALADLLPRRVHEAAQDGRGVRAVRPEQVRPGDPRQGRHAARPLTPASRSRQAGLYRDGPLFRCRSGQQW